NENNISDIYDEFSFNLVVYNDDCPVGTGRLLFKDGKYLLDNICVLKEFRGNHYSDLIIRMLVRKAVNLGAEKTFAFMDKKYEKIFKQIGFEVISNYDNNNLCMVKNGDVGGHCCN
ncbi:MAG: family N-acetyltransferase, partial [Bacillota bacterium]|nr:family N-acetyltransferase [Bacillota bacterium]